jgi:anti-sigma B factor antagonist
MPPYRTEVNDTFISIFLEGDLDANSSIQADEQLSQLMKSGQYRLHFDFTNVEYISSAGIGVFLSYQDEISEKGGKMVFSGLRPRVLNVFQLLGLDQLLEITPTSMEALERLKV